MKTVGIIAEYNPFHTGHEYQITYTKEKLGADFVVVAMSGDFVQRGTPALFSKYTRAKMALLCGADLVLELPVSVSTASAELFAKGGVQLLDSLGVINELCFGSECGDAQALMELAEIFTEEPVEFKSALRQNLKNGLAFPKARSMAIAAVLPDSHKFQQLLSSPNNILGIEYCKAILREHSAITPVAIKREGNAYHENTLSENSFPSASAIRNALFNPHTDRDSLLKLSRQFLPPSCQELFLQTIQEGLFLGESDFDLLYRYCLLQETEENLCTYLDMSPSLTRRVLACKNQYETFSQFTLLLKTKEITHTRIQRALLHILLHIQDTPATIPYARVLGFRKSSSALLNKIKKQGTIPLLTKLSDAKKILEQNSDFLKILRETTFASNLYETTIAQKKNTACIHEYSQQIIIL